MNKIFYLLGKSACGKDTVYDKLLNDSGLGFSPVVLYTTRPIRVGEQDGVTYNFRTEEFFKENENSDKMIESRVYQTMLGPWYYFTMDDGQIDLSKNSFLMIGTLESYEKMVAYYGNEVMVPLYLYIDDAERLQRALNREKGQKTPHVDEVCRRYLADEADFSEEKLTGLGITNRFYNDDLDRCIGEIVEFCCNSMK